MIPNIKNLIIKIIKKTNYLQDISKTQLNINDINTLDRYNKNLYNDFMYNRANITNLKDYSTVYLLLKTLIKNNKNNKISNNKLISYYTTSRKQFITVLLYEHQWLLLIHILNNDIQNRTRNIANNPLISYDKNELKETRKAYKDYINNDLHILNNNYPKIISNFPKEYKKWISINDLGLNFYNDLNYRNTKYGYDIIPFKDKNNNVQFGKIEKEFIFTRTRMFNELKENTKILSKYKSHKIYKLIPYQSNINSIESSFKDIYSIFSKALFIIGSLISDEILYDLISNPSKRQAHSDTSFKNFEIAHLEDKFDYKSYMNPFVIDYILSNKYSNSSLDELYFIISRTIGTSILKISPMQLQKNMLKNYNKKLNKYINKSKNTLSNSKRWDFINKLDDKFGKNDINHNFPKEYLKEDHAFDEWKNGSYCLRKLRNIMEHRYINITNDYDPNKKYERTYTTSNDYLRKMSVKLLQLCRNTIILSLLILKQPPFNFK